MPQLPAGWEETTLGEVAIINPTEYIKKGEVAKNIPMDFLDNFTRKISKYTEKEFSWGMKFRNWDTLFARITPCLENGKTAYVDILDDWEIAFWSTEYIVIREKKERSNSMFLYYLSVSPFFRDIAIKAMTGTSWRQRVQTDVLVNTKLHLPPLPEQQAIAAVLSSFDDKIELLRAENQTLEQMGQELFKERFGKWKIGDDLPEGWRVGKLGEIIKFIKGKKPKAVSDSYKEGWIPQVLIETLDGWISLFADPEKSILLNSGEIVMVMDGASSGRCEIGFSWVLWSTLGKIDVNPSLKLMVYALLKNKFKEINGGTTGSSIPHTDKNKICDFDFIIPTKEILYDFNKVYWNSIEKILSNRKQIQTLSATRDLPLPKLMSGEVRVEF